MIKSDRLLQELHKVRWHVAGKTFGNNHATLIGLLVDWWISLSPTTHTALEGGPSNGYSTKGKRGQCDALFCENGLPAGVLEVEGYRYLYTAKKIGSFFAAQYDEFKSLQFGILVLYTYEPKERGMNRHLPSAADKDTLQKAQSITRDYRGKEIVVISLDKKYIRQYSGIRAKKGNEYYFGEPSRIQGFLFSRGRLLDKQILWEKAG